MSPTTDKMVNQLIKDLEREGWRVEYARHIKLFCPTGGMVVVSRTPSCARAYKNTLALVRRLQRQGGLKE